MPPKVTNLENKSLGCFVLPCIVLNRGCYSCVCQENLASDVDSVLLSSVVFQNCSIKLLFERFCETVA